jgi:hypothetical protein
MMRIDGTHTSVPINVVAAKQYERALLQNFATPQLQLKRFINSHLRISESSAVYNVFARALS